MSPERKPSLLRALRQDSGLVLRDVAHLTGISRATISRIELGARPDIRAALRDNRFEARWAQPFEIVLRVEAGAAEFSQRPMLELLRKKAVQMLLAGMRENDVAQETGLNRFQIYRLHKKVKSEGQAAAEAAE